METELKYKSEISKLIYDRAEEYLKQSLDIKNNLNIMDPNYEKLNKKCISLLQKSKYFFQYSNHILREQLINDVLNNTI
jgi:hypothetical protein